MSNDRDPPAPFFLRSALLYFAAGVAAVYAWNSPVGAGPRKFAQQSMAVVEFDLASMYFDGDFLEKNPRRAAHWYRLAARNGDAARKLAAMYAAGQGVPVNPQLARQWSQFVSQPESSVTAESSNAVPLPRSSTVAGSGSMTAIEGSTAANHSHSEPARREIPPLDMGPAIAVAEEAENNEKEFRRNQLEEERLRLQNQEFAEQARERDRLRVEAEDRQREENARMLEEQNNQRKYSYGGGQSTSNE